MVPKWVKFAEKVLSPFHKKGMDYLNRESKE